MPTEIVSDSLGRLMVQVDLANLSPGGNIPDLNRTSAEDDVHLHWILLDLSPCPATGDGACGARIEGCGHDGPGKSLDRMETSARSTVSELDDLVVAARHKTRSVSAEFNDIHK